MNMNVWAGRVWDVTLLSEPELQVGYLVTDRRNVDIPFAVVDCRMNRTAEERTLQRLEGLQVAIAIAKDPSRSFSDIVTEIFALDDVIEVGDEAILTSRVSCWSCKPFGRLESTKPTPDDLYDFALTPV
jgi:hypothetical protein